MQEFFNRVFSSDAGDKPASSRDSGKGDKSGGQSKSSTQDQPSQQQPPKSQTADGKSDAPSTAKAVAAAPAKPIRAANGLPIPQLPPTNGSSYSRNEVLGLNLSAPALKRAEALGFTVLPPTVSGASGTAGSSATGVTRMLTPGGLDANLARDLLRERMPAEQFELNRVYRLYKVEAAAPKAQRIEAAAALENAVPCRGDHCNGRKLIDWKEPAQDHLRYCSSGLAVGVIDTGVDRNHPNLAHVKLKPETFISAGRTEAANWHGTGVLGVLGGDPRSGTPGLIPEAEFYSAGVFFADGENDLATDTSSVIAALRWMEKSSVKVVNMSFAGPKDDVVEKEIARLSTKGMVFVAAAGNEGPTAAPSYPAAYRQVVAVTAVSKDKRNYPYANRGDHIDIAAPGVDVWTAVPGAKEGYYSGTSFAAPYVTATMATVYRRSPVRDKDQLLAQLAVQDLGVPGRDAVYGRGLLMAPPDCAADTVNVAKAPGTPSVVPASAPASVSSGWETSISGVGAASRNPTISAGFR